MKKGIWNWRITAERTLTWRRIFRVWIREPSLRGVWRRPERVGPWSFRVLPLPKRCGIFSLRVFLSAEPVALCFRCCFDPPAGTSRDPAPYVTRGCEGEPRGLREQLSPPLPPQGVPGWG